MSAVDWLLVALATGRLFTFGSERGFKTTVQQEQFVMTVIHSMYKKNIEYHLLGNIMAQKEYCRAAFKLLMRYELPTRTGTCRGFCRANGSCVLLLSKSNGIIASCGQ